MTTLDWVVIASYLLGMIGLSVYLGRGQSDQEDYYVGGRQLPWWAVGISTMATQTSAISFISVPAFVALAPGGGLTWLQYELALPLAMIFIMVVFIPFFRKLELISVYEYLEYRFGPGVRYLLSAVFLVSRGLGTGVGVFASAIVLEVCLGIPLWANIILIGVVTVIYDTIGGMKAVVYSDVIQMVVLLGGLFLCIWFAAEEVGGFGAVFASLPEERWHALQLETGIRDGAKMPFWAFLIGGFFLYSSYYGVDQSQAQRELSAPTMADTKKSLVLNGLVRFPLTMLYLLLGIAVGAVYLQSPELRASVPADHLDYAVPQFILQSLPAGVRGVLFAAMLAASMSSLDSALNSLSAATMRDFIEKNVELEPRQQVLVGKVTTVIWGVFITGFAFFVGNISKTVVEGINKIGSAFYGPILAAFLVGVASKRTNSFGVICGVIAGVGLNLMLWVYVGDDLNWMWWNFTGCAVTSIVAYVASLLVAPPAARRIKLYTLAGAGMLKGEKKWLSTYAVLMAYFLLMLFILDNAHKLAPGS